MVSSRHEASHQIFRDWQIVVPAALRLLGKPLPEDTTISSISPDCTEIRPLERRADSVMRVTSPDGEEFVLVVEAQEGIDRKKLYSWPFYMAYLRERYKVPAALLVISPERATADWAAGPFDLGPRDWSSLVLHPMVIGPGNVPVITDRARAERDLPLAVLGGMIHGRNPGSDAILEVLVRVMAEHPDEDMRNYALLVEAALQKSPAQDTWRKLMETYAVETPGGPIDRLFQNLRAEGKAEGKAEGRAEGKAEDLLLVLESRGLEVTEAERQRVTGCRDLATLDRWFKRSMHATSTAEIFEGEAVR